MGGTLSPLSTRQRQLDEELAADRRELAIRRVEAQYLNTELHQASSLVESWRSRAEAAESCLVTACKPTAARAAGQHLLHPAIMQALADFGLATTQLTYAQHIHPVRRLRGSELEGRMCIVSSAPEDVPPGLHEHAESLLRRSLKNKYQFHTVQEYMSALLVAQRYNICTVQRQGAGAAGDQGAVDDTAGARFLPCYACGLVLLYLGAFRCLALYFLRLCLLLNEFLFCCVVNMLLCCYVLTLPSVKLLMLFSIDLCVL